VAAFQSPSLADCTLVAFDEPGTGLAVFDPDAELDVSALAEMTESVAAQLLPGPYFVAGASMGGLISLLQLRRYGVGRIQGMINLEGNLCPEDCTFSRRVVSQITLRRRSNHRPQHGAKRGYSQLLRLLL
jgi:pimeloyl-ACP methyl ester carboxylesterase